MSQFTVCRSWNGYCLLLDDDRIAGGKPDYHEGNVFYEWRTRDTYGPVDELQAENDKLRTERDEWRHVAEAKQDIIDHMRDARAENAKLRLAGEGE